MQKKHFLILLILAVGVGSLYTIVKTAPKPQKKAHQVNIPLVETKVFQHASERPTWQGGSSVNGNASVKLVALVAGQVTHIPNAIIPGAFVKKGSELAHIDNASYQLVLKQKKAQVTQAQASLDMELAQVQNAKSDYKLSGINLNKSAKALALRAPQLASAKAVLESARADLGKAQLDLERTVLVMPFDGHIMKQLVSAGGYVNNATAIFEIINSDSYWLEVKVPQNFMAILDQNYLVSIKKLNSKETRSGKILSVLPQVDGSDRQVRILISIDDPLALKSEEIAIRYNDYVQVTLFGQSFESVIQLPSDDLNSDMKIWVVDENSQLHKRFVEVLYKGRVKTWAKVEVKSGDVLLASRLVITREGMKVRLKHDKPSVLAEQDGGL